MQTFNLDGKLRESMIGYFDSSNINRVRVITERIHTILQNDDFGGKVCQLVALMERLNISSISELLYEIAGFLIYGNGDSLTGDTKSLEKEISQEERALLAVALQDIYFLICCENSLGIKKNICIGLIMLNMKYSGKQSGGISGDNIGTHVIEIILQDTLLNREKIIKRLREKSGLNESLFCSPKALNERKKGASCPLYAFTDSNDYIKKIWELIEIVFTVIKFKFQFPKSREEFFLTGTPLYNETS